MIGSILWTNTREKFDSRKESLRKCSGFSEIEHIDNPSFLMIDCNPKEYYEMFEDSFVNKEHKRVKKGSPVMDFEYYASRIVSLNDCNTFRKPPADFKEVLTLIVLSVKCNKKQLEKLDFSSLTLRDFTFQME